MPNDPKHNISNEKLNNNLAYYVKTIGMELTVKLKGTQYANLLATVMDWCIISEIAQKWTNLLKTERKLYDVFDIKRIGCDLPPNQIEVLSRVRAFKRYTGELAGEADYLQDQLPVFFSLLYCHSKTIDNLRVKSNEMRVYEGHPVTNVFYTELRKFLQGFLSDTLQMDEPKLSNILESKDDQVILACFITLFNYETLLESNNDQTLILKKLEYVINEDVNKNDYFDWLKEQTFKNEVKDKSLANDSFIDRYYVLPNIEPSLCSHKNDTINALLTCSPGYGKTSACRAILAACLCDESKELHDKIKEQWLGDRNPEDLFPIYIEAKNIDYYVNHNSTLPNRLIDLVFVRNNEKHNTAVNVIDAILKENKRSILMLLDGLDEVEVKNRQILTGLVDSFCKAYTEANIIITSRPINFDSYKYDENNEQTDVIIGLKKHQLSIDGKRIDIVNKWADILGETTHWASEAERAISINPYLSVLANNPFLLAHMICSIKQGYYMPYEIIYHVVDNLIEKRRLKSDLDFPLVRKLLSYIAFNLLINKKSSIPNHELEKIISEAEEQTKINRVEWKRLAEEIITKSGVLICDYQEQYADYYFQESIIQRFLAAEWLLKRFIEAYESNNRKDDSINIFIAVHIKPVLDKLWKKTNASIWTDIVTMMMILPNEEWRNDFSEIVIKPIFIYLLQTSSTSVDSEQIRCICKILRSMSLEEFSESELLMNVEVEEVKNNLIRLHRVLRIVTPEYYEECRNKWTKDGVAFDTLID